MAGGLPRAILAVLAGSALVAAACGPSAGPVSTPGQGNGGGQTGPSGPASTEPVETPDLGDLQQVSLVYTGTWAMQRTALQQNGQPSIVEDVVDAPIRRPLRRPRWTRP